jgi:tRNA(Ile)-lysidine synthase
MPAVICFTYVNNNIITKFQAHINSFHIKDEKKIVVAVSGGADSLALTFLANQWIKQFKGKSLVALTVNHNLREESENEAKQVHQLLAKHKIEHHILTWTPKEKVLSNIQHKARKARRELLTNWCNLHNINCLLVAHTKNDVAETFFMNLFRGSGIYGLSSILEETIVNNVRIIRPVSSFTKTELKNYLLEQGIEWIEDPSNQNTKFLRTKVRRLFESKELKAIFPDETLFLNRVITNVKNITRARHCIEALTDKAATELVTTTAKETKLDRNKFRDLHPEIALNFLSSCLISISQHHEYKPRLNSLEALYNFICSDASSTKTLWKCKIKTTKDTVHIQKEAGKRKRQH